MGKFKDVVKANPITPAAATSSVSGGSIDAAAAKLSADAYPFMKGVDWTSNLYLKKPGLPAAKEVLAAVDKALVMGAAMDVYNAFSKITSPGVPNTLYSTANPNDAMKAYNAFLTFKDVVKAS